jgi:hypothetical protein
MGAPEFATAKYKIDPENVVLNESGAVRGEFGKYEVEQSAGRLVQFFQYHRKGWKCFTFTELRGFYQQNNWDWNEMLFGLMGSWYDDGGAGCIIEGVICVVHWKDTLWVTKEFVDRVARSK